jgi:unsaturated rhamnogalacturonyl hydrolase
MKRFLSIALFSLTFLQAIQAQSPAERMAATIMKTWTDTLWVEGVKPTKWSYDLGVVLKGIEGLWYQTADPKYFNYLQKSMDYFVEENGNIRTYKIEDYNLDNILDGRMLLTLYKVTSKEKYYKAALILREQLKKQPRTNAGGYWHKKIYPHQMWLDGLYMAEPFHAEFAVDFHEPEAFKDIAQQFIVMEAKARDPKSGLIYHGWDESKEQKWADPKTGLSPHFWARAMGWYGMALVDVMERMPNNNPYKDSLKKILIRFVTAIKKVQDPATGVWYDILNLPKEKGNYLEASASSMFVCTIAKAVRLGYLPGTWMAVADKGYAGVQKEFLKVDGNGQTNLHGTVSVSGLGGNPYRDGSYAYYMSEKVIVNDKKGVGAFLQMANEMALHKNLKLGAGKSVLLDDWFNAEKKKDITGVLKPYHYKWDEMYNNGFYLLGQVFHAHGVQTKILSAAPTKENLKNSDIYLIVDADNITDNPTPNYVQPKDATAITEWVKAGGVLVLLHNDKGNAEFEHFNQLSNKFGIHFNEDSYNRVQGNQYETGAVMVPAGNPILPSVKKIYQKEVSSITLTAPAKPMLKKEELIIFATAKLGKGTVFATADPWLYNEYTDGRKLPMEYQNLQAANDLVKWLIKQIPVKKSAK